MERLKRDLEISVDAINEQIVEIQQKIDNLFNAKLENPLIEDYKIKEASLKEQKFFYYGWLGALKMALKNIDNRIEEEKLEFEEMLESVPTTI